MMKETRETPRFFDSSRFQTARDKHIYRIGILETLLAEADDPELGRTLPGVLYEAYTNEYHWRCEQLGIKPAPARQ